MSIFSALFRPSILAALYYFSDFVWYLDPFSSFLGCHSIFLFHIPFHHVSVYLTFLLFLLFLSAMLPFSVFVLFFAIFAFLVIKYYLASTSICIVSVTMAVPYEKLASPRAGAFSVSHAH